MPAIVEPTTRAGQLLRAWRKQRRLTGEQAALTLKISPATLWRIETGARKPRHDVAHQVVQAGICTHEDFHRAPVAAAA